MNNILPGFGDFLIFLVHIDGIVVNLLLNVQKHFFYAFNEVYDGQCGGIILFDQFSLILIAQFDNRLAHFVIYLVHVLNQEFDILYMTVYFLVILGNP